MVVWKITTEFSTISKRPSACHFEQVFEKQCDTKHFYFHRHMDTKNLFEPLLG